MRVTEVHSKTADSGEQCRTASGERSRTACGEPGRTELTGARPIYTVDSFGDGIAFGQHKAPEQGDERDSCYLRIAGEGQVPRLRSRYAMGRGEQSAELERHLMRLSSQGELRQATMYFGVTSDPFHPFQSKFDTSMKFLDLFKRYEPGFVSIQTRSPLVVIAMPILKKLGVHAGVTIALETTDLDAARKYTPTLPRVDERLKAASALRRFGVPVTIQVAPVLPYGDWRKDAGAFAKLLVENADYIHIKSITDGSEEIERLNRHSPLAQALAQDRRFHYLRPDSAQPLFDAVEKLAPEKLALPQHLHLKSRQVSIFAA